jgi:hypothetical protein
VLSLLGGGTANAGMPGGTGGDRLDARSDAFHTKAGQKLTVSGQGVLRNDSGRPVTLVSHTAPAHGALELNQDGSFSYTPAAGFSGPGSSNEYYGLTDRGPNVGGPNGEKILPLTDFAPSIGKFRFVGTKAVLEKVIPLRAADTQAQESPAAVLFREPGAAQGPFVERDSRHLQPQHIVYPCGVMGDLRVFRVAVRQGQEPLAGL